MIKGIYNENEFYYENYWENKLPGEIKNFNSQISNLDDLRNQLKSAANIFWDIKGVSTEDEAYLDCINKFYKIITESLGFTYQETKFETKDGNFSSFLTDLEEINIFGCSENETGDFDQVALSTLELGDEENRDDRPLVELINEELENENSNKWSIVLAPNSMYLLERSKWLFGRFIKFDWDEIFGINDTENYNFIIGLCHKKTLLPDSGQSIHDGFDEESHRHAFGVTTQLREGVRESIELIVNEILRQYDLKGISLERDNNLANDLTHDALFYVYRLIFMLYLEAQGNDSELLPLKSEIYREGYTLDKLLETLDNEVLDGTDSYNGDFIFNSLERIYSLIYNGFNLKSKEEGSFFDQMQDIGNFGFLLKGIKSDLFNPESMKYIGKVVLSNGKLQEVLKRLTVTREKTKKGIKVGHISYEKLGVNQLGAVYEGLLSYTGYFAHEDLSALKPAKIEQSDIDKGKSLEHIYLCPTNTVNNFTDNNKYTLEEHNFVLDEVGNRLVFKKGSFVYRLAGKERKLSASYYTPDELTKSTVENCLKVLFQRKRTVEQLKNIKILEPAMGSGAFLNEAVSQIASRIYELESKEESTSDLGGYKQKQKRLNQLKFYLMENSVFGVDLNSTAIELARFSLWLNCLGAGERPPLLKKNLKKGNSLVGARFTRNADGVYPWLLIDQNMMSYGKKLKEYSSVTYDIIAEFRKGFLSSQQSPTSNMILELQAICEKFLFDIVYKPSKSNVVESYNKLKFCCDLWCSYFFLTPSDIDIFPNSHEKLLELMFTALTGGLEKVRKDVLHRVEEKVARHGFFHWGLEFPELVAGNGFDLILGNPPWVGVEWEESTFLSDDNCIPAVLSLNAAKTNKFIQEVVSESVKKELALNYIDIAGYLNALNVSFYKDLGSGTKNTYKFFDILSFFLVSKDGVIGLIQEDGVLEDKKTSELRKKMYEKFHAHFQYQNEKNLFSDVGHAKRFSVNIFDNSNKNVDFIHIGNLFLPKTIDECFDRKDDLAPVPLIKDDEGGWETNGHHKRIVRVTLEELKLFAEYSETSDVSNPVFLNLHTGSLVNVLNKANLNSNTISEFVGEGNFDVYDGIDETAAQNKNIIKESPNVPQSISQLIYTSNQVVAFNPLLSQCMEEYKTKFSFEKLELPLLPVDFIPRSRYKFIKGAEETKRKFRGNSDKYYSSFPRIISRSMINPTNERCVFTSIIPSGCYHVNSLRSFATLNTLNLTIIAGYAGSLLFDGLLRIKNKTNFYASDFSTIPIGIKSQFHFSIARRVIALNCLTEYYSEIWESVPELKNNDHVDSNHRLTGFGSKFTKSNCLLSDESRLFANVEVDALVALSFDITIEEYLTFYRILFPVLRKYDLKNGFDRESKFAERYKFFKKRGW